MTEVFFIQLKNTRPPDLSGREFTGPMIKSLAPDQSIFWALYHQQHYAMIMCYDNLFNSNGVNVPSLNEIWDIVHVCGWNFSNIMCTLLCHVWLQGHRDKKKKGNSVKGMKSYMISNNFWHLVFNVVFHFSFITLPCFDEGPWQSPYLICLNYPQIRGSDLS